jgi:hypothetical protein
VSAEEGEKKQRFCSSVPLRLSIFAYAKRNGALARKESFKPYIYIYIYKHATTAMVGDVLYHRFRLHDDDKEREYTLRRMNSPHDRMMEPSKESKHHTEKEGKNRKKKRGEVR